MEQVVPTEYRYISKEVLPTNQFSVTEYFSPMNEFDRTWPGWFYVWSWFCSFLSVGFDYCFPFVFLSAAVYFLYDLSPITVTIKEERRSFLHFITRLCAVLGGTFAVTGLCLNYRLCTVCYISFSLMLRYILLMFSASYSTEGKKRKKNENGEVFEKWLFLMYETLILDSRIFEVGLHNLDDLKVV